MLGAHDGGADRATARAAIGAAEPAVAAAAPGTDETPDPSDADVS